MKYSLRSLMIGVTLFCMLLGGRIEYLRRWALFHEREAALQSTKFDKEGGNAALQFYMGVQNARIGSYLANDEHRKFIRHQDLAMQYRIAALRPWTVVREDP